MKLLVFTCAVAALLLCSAPVQAEMKDEVMVEQTTESPIADMALVDTMKADASMAASTMNGEKQAVQKLPAETQPQTIADFIIHPLIALKPRVPETENGKQADTASTTPSPWQLFGFNAGQGLGSSVSNLAGSVTGWLGNRIQLPGLLETPVTQTSTTSTTTTTTVKPDVVVRVKQRASTRKPLISINNDDDRPFRRKRPNHFNGNNIDYSEEEDDSEEDDEDFNRNRKKYHNNDDEDEEDDDSSHENDQEDNEEEDDEEDNGNNQDDDEEEEEEEKPVKKQNKNRRRRPKPLNHNRRRFNQRRHNSNGQRQQQPQQEESAEVEQYEDDEDDNNDQDFYYNKNQGSKRSQTEQNFIQRGQQSLLNQIRQFTRGQSPAEVSNSLRKSPSKKRRQQATLIINRNGQTIYVAPELLQASDASSNKVSATKTKRPTSQYPQPPLTVPYRRKGQPTQYITIPWAQLGISPPDQIVSLTEGIQTQPLILNIPQSAIDNMQSFNPNKKQSITPEAVPLLAEASIMDIFKPPRIPPARTPTTKKVALSNTPVVIATKPKGVPTRIRPATIVEKAPADENMDDKKTSSEAEDNEPETAQFIVIGDESGETELSRSAYRQILNYFNHHRVGRQLNAEEVAAVEEMAAMETPMEVVKAVEEMPAMETPMEAPKTVEEMAAMETPMEVVKAVEEMPAMETPMEAPKTVEEMAAVETPMEAPKANEEVAPMEAPKTEEQLIPVQVISTEEEPAKVETAVEDKMETVAESSIMDTPMEETVEDVKVDDMAKME